MSEKITLQDIATKLRVSRTTVSLALRDHPRISEQTKSEILSLAKRMGYEPDRVARSLATGHSSLIGVMVPDSTNVYYSEVIRGIEEAANLAGYNVVLATGSYDLAVEARRVKEMVQLRVAGVIAAPAFRTDRPKLNEFWSDLRHNHFPFVLLNRQLRPPIFHQVSADNVAGMRMAVEAIASLGHRRVAYLYGKRRTVPANQRLAVFRHCVRKYNFEADGSMLVASDIGPRGGYDACRQLWSRAKKKPTAIMALSDGEAFGALRFLKDNGLRVPQDVSVMGFDGFELADYSTIRLSTVATPMHAIGKQAVEILVHILNKSYSPQSVILPVKLVLRESVGPVP
ncbi:MAG: LacI family DNA-binding transcriptional regulator [Acidobacteriota bacterium]|nr:LacI family DNA-binding transcriptional regulator [Acidobacteriota bacterium]